jgi:endoglucanase
MYVTAEEGLLLRDGPGKENEVVDLLGYGKEIQAEKIEDGWAYTTVDGKSGWCSTEYLTENKDEVKLSEEKDPDEIVPDELVKPDFESTSGLHGHVDSPEGLNMRYGPGTEYDVIMTLADKTEVIEKGWSGEWVYIEYNGKNGWINSKYFWTEGGKEKPVIYLYPTHTTDVNVRVSLKSGHFTKSIPAGDGEWNVTASPDGTLVDKASGKTYEYIFWESSDESDYDWSEGYVIAGYEAEGFLQEILPAMGLNGKESAQFIEYWLPRLEKNSFNLITFQTDCYTDDVKMDVSPKPDSVLRVFMAFKAVQGPVSVSRPEIKTFDRKGFTVVEWGGAEIR